MNEVSNNSRQKEFVTQTLDIFYTQAVSDFLIGYQFRKIKERAETSYEDIFFPALSAFSTHLARIRAFWYIQLLGDKKPEGEAPFDLISAHLPLRINAGELDRWIFLFKNTLEGERQKIDLEDINELCERWLAKVEVFRAKIYQHIIKTKG